MAEIELNDRALCTGEIVAVRALKGAADGSFDPGLFDVSLPGEPGMDVTHAGALCHYLRQVPGVSSAGFTCPTEKSIRLVVRLAANGRAPRPDDAVAAVRAAAGTLASIFRALREESLRVLTQGSRLPATEPVA